MCVFAGMGEREKERVKENERERENVYMCVCEHERVGDMKLEDGMRQRISIFTRVIEIRV